jgi:hypothetical protein
MCSKVLRRSGMNKIDIHELTWKNRIQQGKFMFGWVEELNAYVLVETKPAAAPHG